MTVRAPRLPLFERLRQRWAQGRPLGSLPALEGFAADVSTQFSEFEGERLEHGLENWQKSFELYGQGGGSLGGSGDDRPDGLLRECRTVDGAGVVIRKGVVHETHRNTVL